MVFTETGFRLSGSILPKRARANLRLEILYLTDGCIANPYSVLLRCTAQECDRFSANQKAGPAPFRP
jgi:hypothetical protein